MTSSKFKVQSSIFSDLQSSPLNSELRTPNSGFTYIALLAAVVIIGITLGAAGKYWSHVMLREKEEELIFRGEQYRRAIERYYTALPGRQELPRSIDDLLKDGRTATGKRHLRQKYKDPISGEDFVEIRDNTRGNRIIGVHSPSEKKPLKQRNFPAYLPPQIADSLEDRNRYSEWEFRMQLSILPQPAPIKNK